MISTLLGKLSHCHANQITCLTAHHDMNNEERNVTMWLVEMTDWFYCLCLDGVKCYVAEVT